MSLVHTNKTLKRLYASNAIRWKDRMFEMVDRAALVQIAGDDARQRPAATVYLKWRRIGRCDIASAWPPPHPQPVSNKSAPTSRVPVRMPAAMFRR